MYLKSRTGFDAGGSVVSADGTGEATVEASVSNDTNSEGGSVSNIVMGTCRRNKEPTQKNVKSADTKYFLMERL